MEYRIISKEQLEDVYHNYTKKWFNQVWKSLPVYEDKDLTSAYMAGFERGKAEGSGEDEGFGK